jgi:anti-sigma-K factor RskA
MTPPPLPPEERDQLAAELALGVLDGDDLARARALFAEDALFRASVGEWLGRFGPLLEDIEPLEPREDFWPAIERRLGAGGASNDNVRVIRRQLNVWRGVAAGATALAASLAVVLLTQPTQVSPPPVTVQAPAPMIAMLGDEQKAGMMVATWSAADNSLRVAAAAAIPADPTHSHELWVIPADGTPRSLGTVPAQPKAQMRVEPRLSRELREGATLAVSVEPIGGSPTGLPTGPVIASGKLERA